MNQTTFESWLKLQCRAVPEVRLARAQIDGSTTSGLPLRAVLPAESAAEEALDDLLQLAQRGGRTVVTSAGSGDRAGLRLAYPLTLSEKTVGAIALELRRPELAQQQQVVPILRWGNDWLALLHRPKQNDPGDDETSHLLQSVLGASSFQQAALGLVGRLAHGYGAERASFGLYDRARVRPVVLSDSSGFSPRSALARELRKAMEEVLVGETVRWPSDGDRSLPGHRELAETQADSAILSVPLPAAHGCFGVLTLETKEPGGFSSEQQQLLERMAGVLGPVLALKHSQRRAPLARVRGYFSEPWRGGGRRHWLMLVLLLVLGAGLGTWLSESASYRVGGIAELQGRVQRALIAPFDGYLDQAHARAGERVEQGFVLAELDDRELRLELRQLEGDLNELQKQYRKALAGLDHAEARILKAQVAQAEARIALLQQHLERTKLVAPFAAVVVAGDLSRDLGKPVERGEVLFELAPLDAYRVMIELPDEEAGFVARGQTGSLILAAAPSERLPIEVVSVTSAAAIGAGSTGFRVEARLLDGPSSLRPGMRGLAKVEVASRRRVWIWAHSLFDWLHLKLWAWLP